MAIFKEKCWYGWNFSLPFIMFSALLMWLGWRSYTEAEAITLWVIIDVSIHLGLAGLLLWSVWRARNHSEGWDPLSQVIKYLSGGDSHCSGVIAGGTPETSNPEDNTSDAEDSSNTQPKPEEPDTEPKQP